jgi:predicted methyltransferase
MLKYQTPLRTALKVIDHLTETGQVSFEQSCEPTFTEKVVSFIENWLKENRAQYVSYSDLNVIMWDLTKSL